MLQIKKNSKPQLLQKQILLLLLIGIPCTAMAQDFNFAHFSLKEGLPQTYIYTVTQDARGFLWAGTGNGLSKYNGFTFENYTKTDSLADNFITCSINDGSNLWFGHMDGRLSYYNGNQFHPVNILQPNQSPVTQFGRSTDGQLWASTYADGLLKLVIGQQGIKSYAIKDLSGITSFCFFNNKELLLGTNSGLFVGSIKEPGNVEIVQKISEVPECNITCIKRMKNKLGYFIATENDGIFLLNPEGTLIKVLKGSEDHQLEFTGLQVICEDSRSSLWVGTFGNGLIRLVLTAAGEITSIDQFTKANGFISDNIKTIFEDREGIIWCGNYGEGLTQISSKTFTVKTFDRALYGENILSVIYDRQSKWIGTEKGLIETDGKTGNIINFYGKGSGLPEDSVTSVFSSHENEIWVGTDKNGVYRMNAAKQFHKYFLGNGSLENAITCITGKGDHIWIGTKKGLCHINLKSSGLNWYTIHQGGLPHNDINALYLDKTGRLWISTHSTTLSYIQDEKVIKIPLGSVAGILTLGPITEDIQSRIWVGSSGSGVFMIATDTIVHLTTKEGLLSDYCYALICDKNANLWAGHKGGLSKIRLSDFHIKPIQHFRTPTDTFQFNANAMCIDQQNKLWFGSDKGLISYDPSFDHSQQLPPVLGITSILVNGQFLNVTDKIVLPPGNYNIRINFLGICLKEPTLVTYQFKLDGYDQLSEITNNTSVTYNHLTAGKYKFILNASSGDGATTEMPLILQIIIKVPVWEKWWFYVVLAVLIALLIYSYIKRKEFKFLEEKKILEEKVLERTQEIQTQKKEIELQRDIIDKRNAHITASITYARNIQNAIMPPAEIMRKLLPDSFVLNKPKDIVSGDFYWMSEKNNKVVFALADCTGHGVPGAFMSLLGVTLLNEIVNVEGITNSDDIVKTLRKKVIFSLRQNRKESVISDGFDIAVCVLDENRKQLHYTGAMNDMVYIHDGKLEVLKADHVSVSIMFENLEDFSVKDLAYKNGDVLYLFSDGYEDQFGGSRNKKYMSHRFYDSLLEIHKLPMTDQKEILEKRFDEWKQDEIQTDDVLVLGIRL